MRLDGKRFITPLAIALIAIGSADILFAVDSIPAIFGLTQETYLVFAANAFSLLGLRQLFFLIDGLLDRLVYLSYGLAVILGFIGAKLVIHALHTNELPFVNGGEHITAIPEIPTWLSLAVILVTLVITTVASLAKNRRDRAPPRPPVRRSAVDRRRAPALRRRRRPNARGVVPLIRPGRRRRPTGRRGDPPRQRTRAQPCSGAGPRQGEGPPVKSEDTVELPVWFEVATFVGLTVLLLADLAIVARRPHEPSIKEASLWVTSTSAWR